MVWDGYVKPFRIFGNLYFVGTEPASTHLIDTGDGLMIIDTGYQHSLYQVINNIWELGFSPYDIKYLIHTHGHIDHFGGTRALVELTGAKTVIGKPDYGNCTGANDLSFARELGMEFRETFTPDITVEDGDIISLGNTSIRCVSTPGHTPGAMSFFFDVTDGNETFRAGLQGGMGINTMSADYLDKYGLSYDCRDNFLKAMDRLNEEDVDIFLGNHMQHNNTLSKRERVLAGDKYAFVDKNEWRPFNEFCKRNLLNMIEEENKAKKNGK